MAYIQPRKNKDGVIVSYTIRVHKGRDPVTGNQLKPYSMTWKPSANMTEKQIEKELNRQSVTFEEHCKNNEAASSKIKLADFCPQYLKVMKTSLSPITLDYYERSINRVIIPILGYMRLNEIKPAHVQKFVQQVSELQSSRDKSQNISPATVSRHLVTLKSIFTLAVKLGYISESPAKSEKLVLPKVTEPKIEIFTKQEASKMLACLEEEDLQFKTLIHIAISTGARRGEIVALKFSDVDYQSRKITIERTVYKAKGKDVQFKSPKDYQVRGVTVDERCIELIKELEKEKAAEAERLGSKWNEGGWLFTQWDGKIMSASTPTHKFGDFLKRHGLPKRKFHALRHTSATLLLYGDVNVKQVQSRLGHGDLDTTNKYLHYIEEADVQAANILSDMLK